MDKFNHTKFQILNHLSINISQKYKSKIDYWKMFEKNRPTIAFNNLYIKEKEICLAYISKINSNVRKQINLSRIPNGEKRAFIFLPYYLQY